MRGVFGIRPRPEALKFQQNENGVDEMGNRVLVMSLGIVLLVFGILISLGSAQDVKGPHLDVVFTLDALS